MKVWVVISAHGDRGDVWVDLYGVFTDKDKAMEYESMTTQVHEIELDKETDIEIMGP